MILRRCLVSTVTVLWLLVLTLSLASAQDTVEMATAVETETQPLNSAATVEIFEAPIRLTVNDLPLNHDNEVMYISPTVHDVDGDGKPELIIGDVTGALGIHRNENGSRDDQSASGGDPVWGPRQTFEDSTGEPIKLTNW